MKPQQQKILAQLSKEKQTKRVELARKPQSIKNEAEKIDASITKQKNKVDKSFMAYLKAWNEFQSFLDETESKADRLDRDVSDVMNTLQEIGVDFTKIPELSSAADTILRIENDVKGLRKLYSKPE